MDPLDGGRIVWKAQLKDTRHWHQLKYVPSAPQVGQFLWGRDGFCAGSVQGSENVSYYSNSSSNINTSWFVV